jgi:hypothetical protein
LIQNGNVGTLVFEPVTNRRTNNVTGFVVGVYDIRAMMDKSVANRYIRLDGLYAWRAFPGNGERAQFFTDFTHYNTRHAMYVHA